MNSERRAEHRRNPTLEEILRKLNDLLALSENEVLSQFTTPQYPIILIVGCARSGSTLLLQWLADLGCFAYPTNLLSRFFQAPYIGELIQQILTNPEFDFRDELYELHHSSTSFSSVLGKTKGVLEPHEFWYFWRRFFRYGEIQYLDHDGLKNVDVKTFLAELAAIESVLGKPIAMKGMIINWNIHYINRILPKVLFLHIQRTPLLNAQSLLESRKSFFGSIKHWYSFKPPEYKILQNFDPYSQVAGQIYFTNKAISDQLGEIDPARYLAIDYAEFCNKPEDFYHRIMEKLKIQGWQPPHPTYSGAVTFYTRNGVHLSREESNRIDAAYAGFSESGLSWLNENIQ